MKSPAYKLLWSLLFITVSFFGYTQTILINEDFSSGSLPTGWSNTANSGSDKWSFNDPGNRNISAGNISGDYAILDSDDYGSSNSQNASLTTPSFDASTFSSLSLSFDHQYRDYNGPESCTIEAYDGTNWTTIAYYTLGDENYSGSDLVTLDISSAVNNSSIAKIRFTYVGTYDWWWAIDNVVISGISSSSTSASTGPGGIQTDDIALWLDANTLSYSNNNKVTTWDDLSDESNNATASSGDAPKYKTNKMNGYPVVDFTANRADYLTISDNSSLKPDEISMIVVGKHTTSSADWAPFIIKTSDWNWEDGYALATYSNWDYIIGYVTEYDHNYVRTYLSSGSDNIMTMIYDKSSVKTYFNENYQGSDSYTSNISNSNNNLYLGASPTSSGIGVRNHLDGEIAEVIILQNDITEVERIILHNYLAAKYGISLGANDYYTQDNSSSGNFDHYVSGIGKISNETISSAKGTGIISIAAETSLSNGDFLFWGESSRTPDYTFSTASDYMDRLNSTWRVSTRNTPGEVTISVDESDIDLSGLQSCSELKLVVSNSSTFSSKNSYSLTLDAGVYSASDVTLQDGDYFTLEYQDVIAIDHNGFYGGSGTNEAPNQSDACYKLLITSTANGTYNLTEDANVREIEVQSGGSISLLSDKFLVVSGNIVNNGTITLQEHASLVQQTTGTNANSGSGSYEITRSGNTNSYIYNIWSSPISDANLTTVFSDANPCDMWTFEGTTQSWKYDFANGYSTTCYGNSVTFGLNDIISGGDGMMNVTKGYFIPGNLTAARIYSGEVNNGDYSTNISTTSLGNPGGTDWADDDWNLIGNPYPSGLNADSFWYENAILNNRITDALYFWDEADTNGGYNSTADYASWNLSGGVESGNSSQKPLGHISSGQGFWVVANTTTQVQYTNSMRTTNNSQFFKASPNTQQHNAWFSFTSPSNYTNNILVGYNEKTTDGYDNGYDAHKLAGHAHVRFASILDSDEYVIQSIASLGLNDKKTIPLVVFSDEAGIHTFSNYEKENMPAGFKVFLRDLQLGIDHNLLTSDYLVQLAANITYDQRFELIFKNEPPKNNDLVSTKGSLDSPDTTSTVTSVVDATMQQSKFETIQSSSLITINHQDGFSGYLKLIDITGKLVWKKEVAINSIQENVPIEHLSNGTYFLSIVNKNERLFFKQFIIP